MRFTRYMQIDFSPTRGARFFSCRFALACTRRSRFRTSSRTKNV